MKKYMLKIIPTYSWVMLTIILIVNYIAYFGSRIFTSGLKHYSLINSLDRKLPFLSFFILFYLLAYLQWIIGFVMIGRGRREVVFQMFIGELIAKGIALVCFILLPTTVKEIRPGIETLGSGGIWNALTGLIYSMDAADNGFPSIHCLESWVCFRGALKLDKVPRWYVYTMLGMTLLVFASTVFVKQHALVDIVGGVAAVEIGLIIYSCFKGRMRDQK
ncbi:MAG: phosphatase PAP2 family protein [Acetatifactor sp.]|nr:phosphatase PAP2 family protein [Acetatifactor sp.]